jgi:hypothetical protein
MQSAVLYVITVVTLTPMTSHAAAINARHARKTFLILLDNFYVITAKTYPTPSPVFIETSS